jgi:CRISPR/Cas system-associated endoribonuclease Cas2
MVYERKVYYCKGTKVNSFGIPLYLLKDKSRIKGEGRKRKFYNVSFDSPFKKDSPKNLLVMYDIPSDKSNERNWFRRHLKKFDYIMIQKSVWVGPSPLPNEFIRYVETIGLKKQLKTFKLSKVYTGKDNNI